MDSSPQLLRSAALGLWWFSTLWGKLTEEDEWLLHGGQETYQGKRAVRIPASPQQHRHHDPPPFQQFNWLPGNATYWPRLWHVLTEKQKTKNKQRSHTPLSKQSSKQLHPELGSSHSLSSLSSSSSADSGYSYCLLHQQSFLVECWRFHTQL